MPPGPLGPPGRGGIPGVGPAGRGATRGSLAGLMNGLLPPGRGAGGRGGAGVAAAGAIDGASGGATGAATTGATGSGVGGTSTGALGPGTGAAFATGFAGAAFTGAESACVGNASLSLRTTGASTVEDALLTNSPWSFNHCKSALLSIPNSFASSWTRALPATVLLVLAGETSEKLRRPNQPGYRDMLIGKTRREARSSRAPRSQLHQEPHS
jgi:hypothetical protein